MAAPSISTYILSNSSHYYGSEGGAAVMTSPSDSVTKVSAIISQTSGGAAIETVDTTVKTSSDQFADRWALSWPTAGIASSPYYVRMWATNSDGDGTVREVAPYIYFPPSVAVTAPVNGSTLTSASVTMAWTASDPYGISAQRVTVLHGADVLLDESVSESDTSYAVPSSVAFLDGESYTFRVTARNGNGMEASADSTCAFSFDAPAAASVTITDDGATATIAVDDPHYSESGATIAVDGSAIADSFTVFGNSTQDGTPTPGAPVPIESIEPQNLLDTFSTFPKATTTYSGCKITNNGDGTYTVEGENTSGGWYFNSSSGSVSLPAGTYTVCGGSELTGCTLYVYVGGSRRPSGAAFTLDSADNITKWAIYVDDHATISGTAAPSLIRGGEVRPYVPYGTFGVYIKEPATAYPIDLQGNALRSLPDGTRDELRVGERKVLVKRCGETLQAVTDGVTGTVGVDVLSSTGQIANGVQVVYKLAAPQEIDLGAASDHPFIPEDGEMWVDGTTMEAVLRPADYAGQPPISSVDIARVNPDGTWTLAQGVTEGQSAIDPLPPLGVAYRYALTSHAAGGGTKVAYAEHTVETRAWHLNFGDAAQEHVSYLYNPQATMTLAQGGESYHFADGGAGRGLPVFYPTTDRDMSGTLKFDTVLYGDSDILLDLCDRYPVAWLRDPFGHRWRAHVRPSVSHGVGQVWPVTISWDAVRFEEA